MLAGLLIAVVDDDTSAREAVLGLVRALGFAAQGFAGAAAFLGAAELARVGCLLADMRMPGMTGLELHRRLVAAGWSIPTVLMTAYPDRATAAAALADGVRCYLARPFTAEALLACLGPVLAAKAQPDDPDATA
jgi:FixJ family two-component response regulator